MTTVQNNNASQALLDSVNGAQAKTKSTNSADSTQDRFLTLLVSQMKNQDPLNPLDNAQVTSQLAQLSTVTGIDKLNATVQTLIDNTQQSQSYQAANLIGHVVLSAGKNIELAKSQAMYGVDLASSADNVTVTVRDANGKSVSEIALGALPIGQSQLQWNGTDSNGAVVPDGKYTFEVKALLAGKAVTSSTLNYAAVQSVTNSSAGIKLNLSDATSISNSDVKQIF